MTWSQNHDGSAAATLCSQTHQLPLSRGGRFPGPPHFSAGTVPTVRAEWPSRPRPSARINTRAHPSPVTTLSLLPRHSSIFPLRHGARVIHFHDACRAAAFFCPLWHVTPLPSCLLLPYMAGGQGPNHRDKETTRSQDKTMRKPHAI